MDSQNPINLSTHSSFNSFPPGYRFRPTPEELVLYYLRRKMAGGTLPPNLINEVDIYAESPESLTGRFAQYNENEWYFFTTRKRMHRNGGRSRRFSVGGYWKATGPDQTITHEGRAIGSRMKLVFIHVKSPNEKKTDWIMDEYTAVGQPRVRLDENDMMPDDFVLCKIYKKSNTRAKNQQPRNSQAHDGEQRAVSTEPAHPHHYHQVQDRTVRLNESAPQPGLVHSVISGENQMQDFQHYFTPTSSTNGFNSGATYPPVPAPEPSMSSLETIFMQGFPQDLAQHSSFFDYEAEEDLIFQNSHLFSNMEQGFNMTGSNTEAMMQPQNSHPSSAAIETMQPQVNASELQSSMPAPSQYSGLSLLWQSPPPPPPYD